MTEVAALGLRVDGADGIDKASSSLDRLTKASDTAERSAGRLKVGADRGKRSLDAIGASGSGAAGSMSALAAAALKAGALLAAAFSVSALKSYADTWSDMQSQVGAATGDMANAAGAMRRLTDIANASYSPLQQTVESYARNVAVLRDLGKSSSQAADFTESLNHMLVLTATRGERAASVQGALSKAMAVGKLEADGLETVLANGGEVAQALANQLGTTVSGLRGMASQGKITGTVIADAIIKPLDDVRARAAEMPATLTDAFVRVQNNMTEFVGRIDKASGASSAMAEVILGAADGIRRLGDYVIAFGQYAAPAFNMAGRAISAVAQYADIAIAALAGFYSPALIGGIALLTSSLATGLVSAIKAVTAAMLANPLGLFVGAVVAAGYAVYKFRDDINQALGIDVVAVAKTAANYVIGSFAGAYELISAYWKNFPTILGAAMVGAVNLYIGYINTMVAAARSAINYVTGLANSVPGVNIGLIGEGAGEISLVDNPYADAAMDAAEAAVEAARAAFKKDWLSGAFSGFTLPAVASFAPDGGGGGKPAKPPAGKDSELAKLIKDLKVQYATLGMTTEQAERYKIETAKGTEADRKRALALYDQIQAWKETEKSIQSAIDSGRLYLAFQEEMQVFQEKADLEAAAVGMSDRQREMAQQALEIRQEFAQKRIELEQAQQVAATALERAQYEERLRLYQEFEDAKLAKLTEANEQRALAEADWTNGVSRAWDNFAQQAQNIAGQTESLFTGMLNNMTSGFGNAFESMVFDSESLGDAIQKLGQNMARSVVNALGQMAAQWLAYQAVQLITGKTTQAAAATALTANATATSLQAGLAAFASTAAIPIVGPILAPAAMGTALAITAPLAAAVSATALSGMAHDGIDSVPETGTWLLQKGERVTTANTSARLDSVLERIDARQRSARAAGEGQDFKPSQPQVYVNIQNAPEGTTVEQRRVSDEEFIIDVVLADMASDGRMTRGGTSMLGWRRQGR